MIYKNNSQVLIENNTYDENVTNFKYIKSIKIKKQLLTSYIDKFNEEVDSEINKQKNKLLLKGICSNLKYINEDNIILKQNNIIYINGIYEENGLLFICNELYKNKKIPK